MDICIFANGQINDYGFVLKRIKNCGYIIACDGGLNHIANLDLVPDIIIGDGDSADEVLLKNYIKKGILFESHPADKNDTDLALSMAHALRLNPSSITIYGALGGRPDHQLANIHVLHMALKKGVNAAIVDEQTYIVLVGDRVIIEKKDYEYISLIPMTTEASGITTNNLLYPLMDETLMIGTTRGISNKFAQSPAIISIKQGILAVICAK